MVRPAVPQEPEQSGGGGIVQVHLAELDLQKEHPQTGRCQSSLSLGEGMAGLFRVSVQGRLLRALETVFRHLLTRLEWFELAGQVERLNSAVNGGIKHLPVLCRLT